MSRATRFAWSWSSSPASPSTGLRCSGGSPRWSPTPGASRSAGPLRARRRPLAEVVEQSLRRPLADRGDQAALAIQCGLEGRLVDRWGVGEEEPDPLLPSKPVEVVEEAAETGAFASEAEPGALGSDRCRGLARAGRRPERPELHLRG